MGYLSDVQIVLLKSDYTELINKLESKADYSYLYLAEIFKDSAKEMTTPDETYVMFGTNLIGGIKWYISYPEIALVEDYLSKHRHSFIRIGEAMDDIEIDNKSEDEWGCDEEFEWFLEVQSIINTDNFIPDEEKKGA
jgi:hypothetical protein